MCVAGCHFHCKLFIDIFSFFFRWICVLRVWCTHSHQVNVTLWYEDRVEWLLVIAENTFKRLIQRDVFISNHRHHHLAASSPFSIDIRVKIFDSNSLLFHSLLGDSTLMWWLSVNASYRLCISIVYIAWGMLLLNVTRKKNCKIQHTHFLFELSRVWCTRWCIMHMATEHDLI